MGKSDYEWYKSRGICPKCRVNDAFQNHVFCPECLERVSNENIKYAHKRAEYQSNQNAARKIRYQERKQSGLCTVCGKKPAFRGMLCNECHAKRMEYRRNVEYQKREGRTYGDAFRQRMEDGICMYCGKEQANGYKFCKSCLDKRRKISRKVGKQNSKNGFMGKEVNGQWKQMKSKRLENT